MQLKEFCKTMVEASDTLWECLTCGLIHRVKDNPATGFVDWSGVVVCPDCKSNMKRMVTHV